MHTAAGRWNASRLTSQLPSRVNTSHARDSEHAVPSAACPDDGLPAFLSVRPRLFGIAYRMLGSAAEAEDIVQDVWVRWQTTDRSLVRDAAAFLVFAARVPLRTTVRSYPLAAANEALDDLRHGRMQGAAVLLP